MSCRQLLLRGRRRQSPLPFHLPQLPTLLGAFVQHQLEEVVKKTTQAIYLLWFSFLLCSL